MRIWTSFGVLFALAFVFYSLIGSSDGEMMTVVGAIMLGYFAILQLAILFVRRWAKQMAAWPCRPLALPHGTQDHVPDSLGIGTCSENALRST